MVAKHGFASYQCLFVVFITGLPLIMPNSGAVSFMPVFSTPHGGPDPVATAVSQVGLPTSVCGQKAIVPVVNPVVPPVADLVGGAMALPGWGVGATLLGTEDPCTRVCRYVGDTTRIWHLESTDAIHVV